MKEVGQGDSFALGAGVMGGGGSVPALGEAGVDAGFEKAPLVVGESIHEAYFRLPKSGPLPRSS